MRQRAIDRGLRLNEFGLIPEDKAGELKGIEAAQFSFTAMTNKKSIRTSTCNGFRPKREDTGEIQSGSEQNLPQLLELDTIQGALHNPAVVSDGEATLERWQMLLNHSVGRGWVLRSFANIEGRKWLSLRIIGTRAKNPKIQPKLAG